jgi:two-component sensor histidine kinase
LGHNPVCCTSFIDRTPPYGWCPPEGASNTVTLEIGERKRAEEHAFLLLGELDHRVKNILSIISSVITQTLKTSSTPGAFAAAMEGRIAAIARIGGRLSGPVQPRGFQI